MSENLLEVFLPHIREHIYPIRIPLTEWKIKEGDVPNAHLPSLNDKKWDTYQIPFAWGGFDKTVWFRNTVTLGPEFGGKKVVLLLDQPESLVYVNGKPHQGIDKNHREVVLTEEATAGQKISIAIEAYSGRKFEENLFTSAEVAVLHTPSRILYNVLIALEHLQKEVDQNTGKELRELSRKTLVYVKYFDPGSEEFLNAIDRALKFLETAIETECRTAIDGKVHLIGHSHIDFAWLWTLEETARKCGRTFSTILKFMEEFPKFRFAQSQAALYELTKEKYPALYASIKQRVAEGRWEPIGSMYVEPDCNIPNGESLVRQILHGKEWFAKEFGVDSDILWLPDTFGYSWSLPQIAKKAGFNYFFTTKLNWNDTNTFPYDTFWWEGIDGTRILSHIPPVGLEGLLTPHHIKKSWDDYEEKETLPHVMMTYGYGDGGGGPTKEHLDIAPFLSRIAGLPQSDLSSPKEFFAAISASPAARSLPVWENELYLELHRGTYTTHGWIKAANRQAERAVFEAEYFSALSLLSGVKKSYPADELKEIWRLLLRNQFHDIVPGTSIQEVYTTARADYETICKKTSAIIDGALKTSASAKKAARVFTVTLSNLLPWRRSEYAEVAVPFTAQHFTVRDKDGITVEHQMLERGKKGTRILCFLPSVPAGGAVSLTIEEAPDAPSAEQAQRWKLSEHLIETPMLKLRIDKRGQFISIVDKKLRREFVRKGARANELITFRDVPDQWEAWDIDASFERHRLHLFKVVSVTATESGPLRATIRVEQKSPNGSVIVQNIRLYHATSRIDFDTEIDWHEKQVLLKAAFPLALRSKTAWFETQFGALHRVTNPSGKDKAKFEVPHQRWMDLSDSKSGVSILNDSKYGCDVNPTTLRLTLLRSPYYPHPIEPHKLSDQESTDQGKQSFRYSFYPHAGDFKKGRTAAAAAEFNMPLRATAGIPALFKKPLLEYDADNILIDAVKKAEDSDSIVFRLHETHGSHSTVTLHFGHAAIAVKECNLLEHETGVVKKAKGGWQVKFKPFEIKTLKVVFRKK